MESDREPPPMHFGNYPDGPYWSAERGDGPDEEETYEVSGTVIRFAPDDTVLVPLWDEEGLLPEEPDWLNRALGLTNELVADIAAWGNEWNQLSIRFTEDRLSRLNAEANVLVDRIRREVPDEYTVVYEP